MEPTVEGEKKEEGEVVVPEQKKENADKDVDVT